MPNTSKPFVIALEEHYWDEIAHQHASLRAGDVSLDQFAGRLGPLTAPLLDLGEGRLAAMDEAGIDLQVLSHIPSAIQQVDPGLAADLAYETNDRLHEAVARHPDRFAGFAVLPTPNPEAAAREAYASRGSW